MAYYFTLSLEILLEFIALFLVVGGCTLLFTFLFGPPFMPTPMSVIKEIVQLVNISTKDVVIDLGSGDGRLLICAARQGATAKGWEINPFLVLWTRFVVSYYRVGKRVTIYLHSYYKGDFSDATVVFLFNLPPYMPKLEQKLKKELQKGTKVISYKFTLPTLKPTEIPKPGIFVYTI